MKRIETYTDYRIFLADYYEDQKKRFPAFSYRYFCRKAGIKSPIYYKDIVAGKRNLTDATITAFIKGLALSPSDARYFTALVHFTQSRSPQDKQSILEQMRSLRRKIKQEAIPLDYYEYYARWYIPVIRELATTRSWKNDFGRLAGMVRPRIKKTEAKESVEFLVKKGFLEIDGDGNYRQSNPAITSGSEVKSLGIRSFNKKMALFGYEAISSLPPSRRDIRTVTIGLSRESYSLVKEEIRDFVNRVIRIVDDDEKSDTVYNLGIQLFPLSTETDQGDPNDANEM